VSSSPHGEDSVTLDDLLRLVPASALIGGLVAFVVVWAILRRR
jgi:hypothetical protein